MSYKDVNDRAAVLEAIAEYDKLGKSDFLSHYGFQNSRRFFLRYKKRNYASKAILAVAHKVQYGTPLRWNEFSGGRDTVQPVLQAMGFTVVEKPERQTNGKFSQRTRSVAQDIAAIESTSGLSATTKATLVLARLGQGKFRKSVLANWGGKCAVTGCGISALIRASHLKPWSESGPTERLDSHNGLPLIANLDALFDKGYISFSNSGDMLVANVLSAAQARRLGIPAALRRAPTKAESRYLKCHRENVFRQ